MFCTNCGAEMKESDRFCPSCGHSTSPEAQTFPSNGGSTNARRLVRTMNDKKIAGVCGGYAKYFGVDSTVMRLIFLGLFIMYGVGLGVYLVSWIVMPRDIDVSPAPV